MVVALIDHKIVSVWLPMLINRLRIANFDLGSIVTGLYPGLNIYVDVYVDRYVSEKPFWSRVFTTDI